MRLAIPYNTYSRDIYGDHYIEKTDNTYGSNNLHISVINYDLCHLMIDMIQETESSYINKLSFHRTPNTESLYLRIEALFSRLISKSIVLENRMEIKKYLFQHQDMVNPVDNILSEAVEYFGNNSQVSLAIYDDPEIDDRHLIIYIRQKSYSDDILDIIDEFDEHIVAPLTNDVKEWLLVTTDFKSPKL